MVNDGWQGDLQEFRKLLVLIQFGLRFGKGSPNKIRKQEIEAWKIEEPKQKNRTSTVRNY